MKTGLDLYICIPVYNDWESVLVLLERLDAVVERLGLQASVMLVDDRSPTPPPTHLSDLRNIHKVEVLRLRRNLGHQRAIAIGLTYLFESRPSRSVVVMDGDGEDAPEDIERLYRECERHGFQKAVFAKRGRRSEGLLFKVGYNSYKVLAYALTGVKVEIGNFSIIPRSIHSSVVCTSEIWNHYAAALIASKVPIEKVTLARAERIAGESRMNFTFLVSHGLRAISVYEQVGVRLLSVSVLLMMIGVLGLAPYITPPVGAPEWVAALTLQGMISLLLLGLLVVTLVVVTLKSMSIAHFLPLRDYKYYVDRVEEMITIAQDSRETS